MAVDPEYTKHQYLYVPWVDDSKFDTIAIGKAIGLYVAQQHKVQPTILCAQKANAGYHTEFKNKDVVTERSGFVRENGVVIAWCPTRKAMQKIYDRNNVIVLVEWPTTRFDAWAKLVGAYNVMSREVMGAGLNDDAKSALDGIVWEGYNGWTKETDRILTLSWLRKLDAAGGYNRDVVLQHVAMERDLFGIKRLEKIVDQFEAARVVA